MLRTIREHLSRLSLKTFLVLILCLVLPMYGMFGYVKSNFEQYIQNELSAKTIQGMSKSEEEIYKSFQNMANISSVLALDEGLVGGLKDPQKSYYDKTIIFDNSVRDMIVNNLFTVSDVKITLLDLYGNVYSNWSLDYNDYSFLLHQQWVQQSIEERGHLSWSMFAPGFIIEPNKKEEKYISLARSVLSDGITGNRLGTLIISIGQSQFSELLSRFSNAEGDSVYVCIDNGVILLKNETENVIPQEHIRRIMDQMEGTESGSLRDESGGKQYLVSYYTISEPWTFDGQRLRVLQYTDYRSVVGQMDRISRQINLSMAVFVVVLLLLSGFISVNIARPVRILAHKLRTYSVDGELKGLDLERRDEIGNLNRSVMQMSERIRELFSKLEHEHEVREKYQFEALRAQVNPHFLFNTLTMIRWMAIVRKADNIVESIDALANMLKYSMSRGGEFVLLREELSNIRSYVFIQNCRFGDRYQVMIDVPEEVMSLRVIKFILQPVVENAVIHGFEEENGTIRISGEKQGNILKIYVRDNGKGISRDVVEKFNRSKERHRNEKKLTGIGLENVHERIHVAYGDPYGISIEGIPGEGTTVTYTLPVLEGEKAVEEDHDR